MDGTVRLRIPQDLLAGTFVVAVAGFFLWWGWDYPMGRAGRIGAGWMPRAICVALIALGLVLLARGIATRRAPTEIVLPTPRVMVLILGAAALFALTGQLGLILTVALACVVATVAAPGFRAREAVMFSVALALFSYLLFVLLLQQGLPVWPRISP